MDPDPDCDDPTTEHEVVQRALRSGIKVRSGIEMIIRFQEKRQTRDLCDLMDDVRVVIRHVEKWAKMVAVEKRAETFLAVATKFWTCWVFFCCWVNAVVSGFIMIIIKKFFSPSMFLFKKIVVKYFYVKHSYFYLAKNVIYTIELWKKGLCMLVLFLFVKSLNCL